MRMWRVVVLLNLALAVGLGFGYAVWGRKLDALDKDLDKAQTQLSQAERERQACEAGGRVGEQQWEGKGILRAIYPRLALITHEEIPDFLPARTTGFRLVQPANLDRLRPGDAIRFWLQGTGYDNNVLVKLEAW